MKSRWLMLLRCAAKRKHKPSPRIMTAEGYELHRCVECETFLVHRPEVPGFFAPVDRAGEAELMALLALDAVSASAPRGRGGAEVKPWADDLFDAQLKTMSLEDDLWEKISAVLGVGEDWPWEDVTYDYYDMSFELKQARASLEFTKAQCDAFRELGFDRAWICFGKRDEPGYSEKHYCFDRRKLKESPDAAR